MSNSRPSPFLTSVIALTLILFGLFCLSPSILFAQDIEDRSDNTEFRPVYSVSTSKKSGTTALLLESLRPLPGTPTVDLAHAPLAFARSAAALSGRAPDRPLVGALGGGLRESPRSGRLRPKPLHQQTEQ